MFFGSTGATSASSSSSLTTTTASSLSLERPASEWKEEARSFEREASETVSWQQCLENLVENGEGLEDVEAVFQSSMFKQVWDKPLEHKGRDPAQKDAVEKMDKSQVDVVNVLRLADELELAEKQALSVWFCAAHSKARVEKDWQVTFHGDTYAVAVTMFYWKRELTLSMLKTLLNLRNVGDEFLCQVGVRLTNDLIQGGLAAKMMNLIESHNKRIKELLSPENRGLTGLTLQLHGLRTERKILAESLFLIFNDTFAVEAEIIGLIKLVRSMSSRSTRMEDLGASSTLEELHSAHETLSILIVTLGSILDRSEPCFDRDTEDFVIKPLGPRDRGLLEQLNDLFQIGLSASSSVAEGGGAGNGFAGSSLSLSVPTNNVNAWDHDGVFGTCLLLWTVFLFDLDRSNFANSALASDYLQLEYLKAAFDRRGLVFLRGLVRSPSFVSADFRSAYIGILDHTTSRLLSGLAKLDESFFRYLPTRSVMLQDRRVASQFHHHNTSLHTSGYGSAMFDRRLVSTDDQGPAQTLISNSDALQDSMEDLLALLQSLQTLEARLAVKFSSAGENIANAFLLEILRNARESDNDPQSFYVAVLQFLTSMTGTKEGAMFVIEELNRSRDLNWESLFKAIEHFNQFVFSVAQQDQQFLNQQQQWSMTAGGYGGALAYGSNNRVVEKEIPLFDQMVLCSWLQLLNGAIRDPECCQYFLTSHIGEVCFKNGQAVSHFLTMLQNSSVVPALKAQLTWTLSHLSCKLDLSKFSLVTDSSQAQTHLQRQGGGNMLAAGPSQGMPDTQQIMRTFDFLESVMRSEISRNETAAHTFPFTHSVIDFVYAVVARCANTGNLLPFRQMLEFIIQEVFLKLNQRKFRSKGEKWKLSSACLKLFLLVLDSYATKDTGATAGITEEVYVVMCKVLEGARFFNQLLSIIAEAGGEEGLRASREGRGESSSRGMESSGLGWNRHDSNFHSQQPQQQQRAQMPWFLVTSQRAHVDIRNSSTEQGETVQPNVGYGMLRIRSRIANTVHPCYDGGAFASWIANPYLYGWTGATQAKLGSQSLELAASPSTYYYWDDGDIGGFWKEAAVKLTIRLLEAASQREARFLKAIEHFAMPVDNRLERLHRLFYHQGERLRTLTGFFQYPYSAEIRLNAIQLVFRFGREAPVNREPPMGSFVQALSRDAAELAKGLHYCFVSSQQQPSNQVDQLMDVDGNENTLLVSSPSMNVDVFDPVFEKAAYEQQAEDSMRKTILRLLIDNLQLSRGNLAELFLGFDGADGAKQASPDRVDLGRSKLCCLNQVLNILDDPEFDWQQDPECTELMFNLIFKLCSKRYTRLAMCAGLNAQRNKFWLRHFQLVVSRRVVLESALSIQAMSWIMQGILTDLHVSMSGMLPNVTSLDLLPTLFTVDSVSGVDQTHLRILEVLDLIPLNDEQPAQSPTSLKQIANDNILKPKVVNGLAYISFDEDRIREILGDQATEALEWIRTRDEICERLSARKQVIQAWKSIVQLSVVEFRDDLISSCCNGQSDDHLLKQLCRVILHKLVKFPDMASPLSDLMGSLVVTLVGQLRFGEDTRNPSALSMDDMAVAAGTGNYTLSFCIPSSTSDPSTQFQAGITRISREELRQLLENLLEAFRCKTRSSLGVSAETSASSLRPSLYAALLMLLFGSRTLYARCLNRKVGRVPAWVTEKTFLSATENMGLDTEVQELRARAITTLECLYSSDHGSVLLEVAVSDALALDKPAIRLTALCVLKVLLECDQDHKWFTSMKRRGVFRHLLEDVTTRLSSDKVFLNVQADRIYTLSLSVLTSIAKIKDGAAAIAAADFLEKLSKGPLLILCDKRGLDAWAVSGSEMVDEATPASQEIRHELVLPFLRLLLSVSNTLKPFPELSNDFAYLLARFLKTQKRMLISALGFPPVCINDIEESTLLLGLLTNCAQNGGAFRAELASIELELDLIVFDMIQELCASSQRGTDWRRSVIPNSKPDSDRAKQMVHAPPDMYTDMSASVSLYQLDVHSQQRRLLQNAIAYCRARKNATYLEMGKENESHARQSRFEVALKSLLMCIDHCSRSLAAVARSSTKAFLDALSETTKRDTATNVLSMSGTLDGLWSQRPEYVHWTCSSLFFVLEGALAVMYWKLKEIRRIACEERKDESAKYDSLVDNCRRDPKLLVNWFDSSQEKSPIEQLGDVVTSNAAPSQYISLILRRIREV